MLIGETKVKVKLLTSLLPNLTLSRFQGGSNAGHTIINNYGKFALHQLPSGIFYDHTTSIIGNGVALSVENFIKELSSLEERNVPKPNILISDRAQIVMPYHIELDTLEEARLSENSFGSTKSGIAPFILISMQKSAFKSANFMMTKLN